MVHEPTAGQPIARADVMIAYKTLLKGPPEDVREQVDELAHGLVPREYASGERLRAVAVALARREDLEVSFVAYGNGSQELETALLRKRGGGRVTVSRSRDGDQCQLSWEEWTDINGEPEIEKVADMVAAILNSAATVNEAKKCK